MSTEAVAETAAQVDAQQKELQEFRADLGPCAHCGGTEYSVRRVEQFRQIGCPCGIMTKLVAGLEELRAVWKSRPDQPYKPAVIKLKHPGARGKEHLPKEQQKEIF